MRRRTRIDLGQATASTKEEKRLDRKRHKWAEVNKNKPPEENPYLKAIRPDQEHYGDADEKADVLEERLHNLEFGNFPGYYQYRTKSVVGTKKSDESNVIEKATDDNCSDSKPLEHGLSDERMKGFKREWFEGKDVLDIGCNRGHITYAIARLFSPNIIIGIDIDPKMVSMANKDLHLQLEEGIIEKAFEIRKKRAAELKLTSESGQYVEDNYCFPLASYIAQGPLAVANSKVDDQAEMSCGDKIPQNCDEIKKDEQFVKFPNNIIFLVHNYVLSRDELVERQSEQFNVIVCLSVTKWIHLNYRDSGLKRFFKRVYKHLKAEGIFILEAQPFDNYGRRRKLSDRLKSNYYSIKFKPEEFDSYLLSEEVGFKRIIYESIAEHECVGFKRPIKVFLK